MKKVLEIMPMKNLKKGFYKHILIKEVYTEFL